MLRQGKGQRVTLMIGVKGRSFKWYLEILAPACWILIVDHVASHQIQIPVAGILVTCGSATSLGSPEREAVLARWAPIHAAALALADELSGE